MKALELLHQLNQDVVDITTTVTSEIIHLSTDKLNRKPTAHAWSALQCFEHLNRYNAYYIAAIERSMVAAGLALDDELTSTWIGRKSIAMMHPSNQKKQKTFKKMDPSKSDVSRNAMDQFMADQERLVALIAAAKRKNINAKRVPVEFFKLLKMTIAEALEFVVVHERRHLRQIVSALRY